MGKDSISVLQLFSFYGLSGKGSMGGAFLLISLIPIKPPKHKESRLDCKEDPDLGRVKNNFGKIQKYNY